MAFGDRLREAREAAGLSRPELAKKLGVTKSAISNYENGVSSPKEDVMLKIFNALAVEPNYLFQDSFMKADITQQEFEIINKYRFLDFRGKNAVLYTLEKEAEYIKKARPLNEQTDDEELVLPIAARSGEQVNITTTKSKLEADIKKLVPTDEEEL